ncbi:glutaredoxin 2 [Avibacterium paragallinarum]|uniref:Glutaredoxin-2 n=1 Tax=Avibacterium paragallinarum TaxID=728 RepID=A0A0F5F0Q6_AVIPA|nr:glutaredoxin 2 [Avibacterium paragallinarum]KAA6210003.1 glutaredoxin 2 [Avibacterium paragallinarum]KKB01772.1 glutaredoxin [Avibacterium paragallinarum]RZN74161.1 glutaredoxin 2 [Avibacterium paragallinarum]SUU97703.1 Glutaredoxin-2 [Avibacterium paragallinarum]
MKLYVYDHCPFCVRARMIFGLKNIPVEKVVLLSDDETTPVSLIGKKMAPILIKEDGTAMPESLDIVHYVDQNYGELLLPDDDVRTELQTWIQKVSCYYNHLLLSRFVKLGLPEFATQSAVDYFVKKKTESIGDFAENLANSAQYIEKLQQDFTALEYLILSKNGVNDQLSMEDILLFPMLRNLTCVKGLVFPPKVKAYVETMAKLSQVELYFDKAV